MSHSSINEETLPDADASPLPEPEPEPEPEEGDGNASVPYNHDIFLTLRRRCELCKQRKVCILYLKNFHVLLGDNFIRRIGGSTTSSSCSTGPGFEKTRWVREASDRD